VPAAQPASVNRLLLLASLVERQVLRYTPAGLPALNLSLKHEGQASEDGQPRKVSLEIRAVGIGQVTQPLGSMALGSAGLFAGFLAPARNGRGLVFHITAVEPVDAVA
jgi:primosomal replication protein N